MTDTELLERAARAVGYTVAEHYKNRGGVWCPSLDRVWAPLEDDGDAFRLLLAIEADIYHGENEYGEAIVTVQPPYLSLIDAPFVLAYSTSDIRRAIVRAAAAMADEEK